MTEKRITNTADISEVECIARLPVFASGYTRDRLSNAIEASESAGQRELVESTQLPTNVRHEDRASLEAAGVKFGATCADDPLFCDAELPPGWRKVATDHAMHSDLLDERGRRRGSIFYKAAFYDRRASLTAIARFAIESDFDGVNKTMRIVVSDGGNIVRAGEWYSQIEYARDEVERKTMRDALTLERPDWGNAAAYWDEP